MSRIWSGHTNEGQRNAVIYDPGQPCEAFPGCPIFARTWTVIVWFPGTKEELHVFGELAECEAMLRGRGMKLYPAGALRSVQESQVLDRAIAALPGSRDDDHDFRCDDIRDNGPWMPREEW